MCLAKHKNKENKGCEIGQGVFAEQTLRTQNCIFPFRNFLVKQTCP